MVNKNFTKLFQKSRGDGLLKHLMKKRLYMYIQIRFDEHGLILSNTN